MARSNLLSLRATTKIAIGTIAEIERQLETLPNARIARVNWQDNGEVILCDTYEVTSGLQSTCHLDEIAQGRADVRFGREGSFAISPFVALQS